MKTSMETLGEPYNVVAFTVWLLLVLLHSYDLEAIAPPLEVDDEDGDTLSGIIQCVHDAEVESVSYFCSTLNYFMIATHCPLFVEELRYWVKSQSTTWFSRFLLLEYDDNHWIQMFRMSKRSVFSLADLLSPYVARQNTNYRLAILVVIRVACTLFKLTHGANLTICSELFAIGRSTISKILWEVVRAVNETLRHELVWPTGSKITAVQQKFANLCGLPAIIGTIDGMQISISKPSSAAADYFYFKSGNYSMNCQAVVDSEKKFLDLYVGMPRSTNDSRMLQRSSLFHLASQGQLFQNQYAVDGHNPYFIGDLGYPLLSWLMVPHRGWGDLSLSEALFNRRLRRARSVVENAFGIFKQTFHELLQKSKLHLTFLPDVVFCCAILHYILLGQSHEDVENLLNVLRTEGLEGEVTEEDNILPDNAAVSVVDTEEGSAKRDRLGMYLSTRRCVAQQI